MKNVHLLLAGESYLSLNCSYRDSAIGTEVGKPYWTYSKDWKHHMSVTDASVRPHNIYITSDEEIKDGDYYLYLKDNSVQQFIKKHHTKLLALDIQKKIILTTDQDLIKDDVQSIDDDFLEWFVKNPSCDFVEFKNRWEFLGDDYRRGGEQTLVYKIIIPKEEAKQETLEERRAQAYIDFAKSNKDVEMYSFVGGFNIGYKLAQEQDNKMYSEEEMFKFWNRANVEFIMKGKIDFEKLFEQFRKK